MKNASPKIPRALLVEVERYGLRIAADLHRLDSEFQIGFARATRDVMIPALEDYCVQRFDAVAEWFSPLARSQNPADIGPTYEVALNAAKERTLEFLATVMESQPQGVRGDSRARVALLLEAHRLHWLGRVKAEHLERHPVTPFVPAPSVSAAVVKRRKEIVGQYRRTHDLTAPDFARKVGMSETAIRGIIKEDRSRFALDAQRRLLRILGISIDQWNRP